MFKILLGVSASLLLSQTALAVDAASLRKQANVMFKPLPSSMPSSEKDSAAKIALGEKLYFETALSINGTQSCNTCHRLDEKLGGVDNKPFSPGALPNTLGGRNSPTTWNAGFHFAQFWDGRAANLAEQAKGPILNPVEMALPNEQAAVDNLKKAGYSAQFDSVFGQKNALTFENIAQAIAAFERTLITKDRFDDFLKGSDSALSKAELEGLDTFIKTGCTACHTGPLFGAQMYQKMGLVHPFPSDDKGRMDVTGKQMDAFMFKVPSLRNISKTAPYFHNGSAATLEQAVKDMAWYQLGQKIDDKTTTSIVTFLHSLENQREFKRSTK